MLPGTTERDVSELEEPVRATPPPPLELRRTTSVPLSLPSPGDRISGNYFNDFPLVPFNLINILSEFQTPLNWRQLQTCTQVLPESHTLTSTTVQIVRWLQPLPNHRQPIGQRLWCRRAVTIQCRRPFHRPPISRTFIMNVTVVKGNWSAKELQCQVSFVFWLSVGSNPNKNYQTLIF